MMIEYIERETAIEAAFSANELGNSTFRDVHDVVDRLRLIPAADVVEVRHGEWIGENGNAVEWDPANKNCPKSSCYCSECKEWLTASDEYPVIGLYCPNCGAKMNGGVNND